LIKVILALEVFFILLSPKGVKGLFGYEGIYPNPQFFFMLFVLPILFYGRAFDFIRPKKYRVLILLISFISVLYFSSLFIAIKTTSVATIHPAKESLRQTLNYFVIFLPFLLLRRKYLIFSLRTFVVYGLLEMIFVVYGVLVFFHKVPASEDLAEIVTTAILAQSWTVLTLLPKWGGTFEETQILSTFFLICFIIVDFIGIKWKGINFSGLLKCIFGLAILYCFSKSTIPALLFYLFFRRKPPKDCYTYPLLIPVVALIVLSFPLFVVRGEISQLVSLRNLERLGLSYSSLGERLFHIYKALEFMMEDPWKIILGLGPRVYGTLISLKYPDKFCAETNCVSGFTVLADIGFLGFTVFLLFLISVLKSLKSQKVKSAYLSVLIACFFQIGWGVTLVLMFIGELINYDQGERKQIEVT